jgi:hypothetical protein
MNLVRHPKFLDLYEKAQEGRYLDECWPWPGTQSNQGYGVIWLDGKQHVASRLILEASSSEQVLHVCDNPPCVNPAHLQRGTVQENQYDKGRKGRAARGEENRGGGKLKEQTVRDIRNRLSENDGSTLVDLGKEFGVSATMISNIRDGRAWRHVK